MMNHVWDIVLNLGVAVCVHSLVAPLPHISSGTQCRWRWQMSRGLPPTSQEESLPLNTHTHTRKQVWWWCSTYHIKHDAKRRKDMNPYISPARRCSACTSGEAGPSYEAAGQNNGSDLADSFLDTAPWPEQRRDQGFDGKSRSRIWPRHKASHTAAGCHRDRCLETCEGTLCWETPRTHLIFTRF